MQYILDVLCTEIFSLFRSVRYQRFLNQRITFEAFQKLAHDINIKEQV